MNKLFLRFSIVITVTISLFLASCNDCLEGNGKQAVRSAKFAEITSIDLSVGADVKLVDDSTGTVKIEGESNIINDIELTLSGTSLRITSLHCLAATKPITISIPMQNISKLELAGSGSIKSENKMTANDLNLEILGSGDIELEVDAANVWSKVAGSGNIILKGTSKRHKIEIEGSGNVEAEIFPTPDVSVEIDGSGDCKVLAINALSVSINGSGSVYYSGSPDISSDIKGSGSLEKIK